MPRYVILEHDHPHLHWDLMLDIGPTLRTWRLEKPPQPGETVRAEMLGAHRRLYLDYEGPVSGGRGCVRRWDAGEFTIEEESAERLAFRMSGQRCQCTATLTFSKDDIWRLVLEM